ncbi:hypothetical protein [Haliangium sp.]|uniref:hypothetical protein n=1 Tax=Haliangium sp. TaxID=2663208 RepID=UPI003D143B00
MPLRQEADGIWVALVAHEDLRDEIDAASVCVRDFQLRYAAIEQEARLMRALCEHPDFEFTGDGVDSAMVRERAQAVSRLLSAESTNVRRLLGAVAEDDAVRIDAMDYRLDDDGEFIEPRRSIDIGPLIAELDRIVRAQGPPDQKRSAGEHRRRVVEGCLRLMEWAMRHELPHAELQESLAVLQAHLARIRPGRSPTEVEGR